MIGITSVKLASDLTVKVTLIEIGKTGTFDFSNTEYGNNSTTWKQSESSVYNKL